MAYMAHMAVISLEGWDGVPSVGEPAPVLDARFMRTRKALINALLELLHIRAFDLISIREITAKANVGYATFYRHYATKEALLLDLAGCEVARLIRIATPVAYVASMRDSVRATCSYVMERNTLWRAMLSGSASGILREQFIRQTVRLRGSNKHIASWLPEELHLTCATGATVDVIAWWLGQKPMPPVDEVVGMIDRLIAALTAKPSED